MKDKFGNEINIGDIVLVRLSQAYVIGRLVEVRPGGVVVGGTKDNPLMKAPEFTINSDFAIVPGLDFFRLVNPARDVIHTVDKESVS